MGYYKNTKPCESLRVFRSEDYVWNCSDWFNDDTWLQIPYPCRRWLRVRTSSDCWSIPQSHVVYNSARITIFLGARHVKRIGRRFTLIIFSIYRYYKLQANTTYLLSMSLFQIYQQYKVSGKTTGKLIKIYYPIPNVTFKIKKQKRQLLTTI